MNEYRVDKQEHPVAIFLSDGLVLEGVVFLSPYASSHSGTQSISDLLNEKEQFFPFRSNEGAFSLVNKEAVSHIRYLPTAEEEMPLGERKEVRLHFFGRESLQGVVVIDLPRGKNRLVDFINSAPPFFVLEGDGCQYVANRTLICQIAPAGTK
ncbi:hypothetical protein DESUT3_00690 [Desulfuromonas versatilis]|uniref:Uncharacterized protein n=1 Tax=Desulfuromonas versatilis TaxID=2802975 RepID=A0ABM8HNJ4_9BACT|nr:hypothetical protein [Desulfuromonas versatilis]BCR03000.1 hypothetical protein DESUT3_00690 [Desulfuromonas versatilis]